MIKNRSLDPRLEKIVAELKAKYDCHTIILYGSRARGDETVASDYDILAIRDKGKMERDSRYFEGAFLDCFIYSMDEMNEPNDFLRIKDGMVICQKETIGDDLIAKVKALFEKGFTPKPDWEKQVIVSWGQKMLQRANIGDIEGNYRAHWLLYDLLESYFVLRDQWYLGPKEAFQWLKINDPLTYELFDNALKQKVNVEQLKKLNERVTLGAPITNHAAGTDKIVIKNINAEIAKAEFDPKVNIKIALLVGDETMTMYSTVLKPGSQVKSHVHSQGIELYFILKGTGEIYTGRMQENSTMVNWEPPQIVRDGDVFSINPGTVHQLKNTSETNDLMLIFICPKSHLGSDRVIASDFSG